MPDRIQLSYTSALILHALTAGYRYGFDIMDSVGLPSGTVYPALRRLEKTGLVEAHWEDVDISAQAGRPRRRYYEITPSGGAAFRASRQRYRLIDQLLVPKSAG